VSGGLLITAMLTGTTVSAWFAWQSNLDAHAARKAEASADQEAKRAIAATEYTVSRAFV
jgi:hypothetical protein